MDLNNVSKEELLDIAKSLQVLSEKKKYNKIDFMWPDDGPFRRDMYPKQMAFFRAGDKFKERALIAANRCGKTYVAISEMVYHLTGKYPEWWEGKRFNHPIKAWEVGKTSLTTRDILQKYIVGERYDHGTGMVPHDDIIKMTTKAGVPEAIQDIYIKHYTDGVQDGVSELTFKSYDQGVDSFMGTSIHVCHLDEEPTSPKIYSECLMRTMTTKGIIMCTFTPLDGLSETVLSFLPDGKFPPGGIGVVLGPNDRKD